MDILIEELEESLWVVAMESGKIKGIEIDPAIEEIRYGSVYWAKVERIDKSLDAAFLSLDGNNKGILFNRDVRIKKDGKFVKGGSHSISKTLSTGQMVIVQAKEGWIPKYSNDEEVFFEDKTPRVSMNITIQGRHLIYTPQNSENKVSQRIKGKELRKQLNNMLDNIDPKKGIILRNSAAGTQEDILIRELKILKAIWEKINEFTHGEEALIMAGPDAIQRTLSDNAHRLIDRIEVVVMDHYQDAEDWCELYAPDLVTKITPIELNNASKGFALFEHHDILNKLEELVQPYVILPSGGSLIIQDTSAMTVIDVNKGADKRNALSVNIEAAQEALRQARIRNIGGIIIIDFINMKTKKEKDILLTELKKLADNDPCTVQIHDITKLGLAEITRARRTPPLIERFHSTLY